MGENLRIAVKNILRSTSILSLIFICLKFLGFLEKIILAHFFGTTDAADAYFWALSIPFSLYLIVEEIIGPVFVPFLVDKISAGATSSAKKIMKRLLIFLAIIVIAICVAGVFFAPLLTQILAPGFVGEKLRMAISLLRSLFVILIFLSFNSYLTVLYHAYKQFNLPVIARGLEKICIIGAVILFADSHGIFSAVIGAVVGASLHTVLLIIGLPQAYKKTKASTAPIDTMTTRQLPLLMAPLLLGVVFSQISGIIDNLVVSSQFSGAVASLAFGRKIIDLPVLMVPFALGIVLLPYFSDLQSKNRIDDFAFLFEKVIRWLVILFIFIMLVVLLFNQTIVSILFERGQFNATSTQYTSRALFWFAFGLLAFALEVPLMQSFFALKNTFTPIWIGVCCASLNILLTVLFVQYIGFIIVPIALAMQKSLKIIWLFIKLRSRIPININDLLLFLSRNILAGILAVILFMAFKIFITQFLDFQIPILLDFLCSVISLFIFYVVAMYFLGIREISSIVNFIFKNRLKWHRAST